VGVGIELREVTKEYRIDGRALRALDGLSLSVEAGSVVAIGGPSGSGKSTLLHIIGAMDRPDSGTVRVGELTVESLNAGQADRYRRTIGFVFQRFHLLAALTALDNVIAPVLPLRVAFDRLARGRQLLAAVGLAGRESSVPSRLSGGEQQRVAIARSLINDPVLILADEPTGNLDSETGEAIMDLLLRLRTERAVTIVLATHDSRVAERCDQVVRMQDGRVVDLESEPSAFDGRW
jgi:putative ABC transport system ATP-binding protein